jgi:hypothetical protein
MYDMARWDWIIRWNAGKVTTINLDKWELPPNISPGAHATIAVEDDDTTILTIGMVVHLVKVTPRGGRPRYALYNNPLRAIRCRGVDRQEEGAWRIDSMRPLRDGEHGARYRVALTKQ